MKFKERCEDSKEELLCNQLQTKMVIAAIIQDMEINFTNKLCTS